MANMVTKPETGGFTLDGLGFLLYAHRYYEAAEVLRKGGSRKFGDPLQYHLLCQSLELNLKAFIWLVDRPSGDRFKNYYKHKLVKLWEDSKAKGIRKYCALTPLRDQTIALVGPYYRERQFAYLDVEMLTKGFPELEKNKKVIPTLRGLCKQLLNGLTRTVGAAS